MSLQQWQNAVQTVWDAAILITLIFIIKAIGKRP